MGMNKLIADGRTPDQASFNAVVTSLAQSGDLEQADDWFNRPLTSALHPELVAVAPDATSYNALVVASAQHGDLPRAETYARTMQSEGMTLTFQSYTSLIQVCLQQLECRRAHRWCEEMVATGWTKPNKAMMVNLVRTLSDSGN